MDLNAMFQNLGPAGGSLLTGMQMADATNEQRSQEAMRKAQMDEIMQRTAQTALMNPLELQAKQQAIASADMKAKQEKNAYRDEILTKAIPEIEKEPPLRRHARLEQIFNQAGLPLDDTDRQAFYNMQPDELVKNIKAKHEFNVKNSPDFMKAMAQEELRKTSHLEGIRLTGNTQKEIEGMREAAKQKLAQEKGSLEKSLQQDLSGAKTYQAQSVVYANHAAKARLRGDTEEAARLEALGKEATIRDLQARAAAGDAQAAQRLQALQMVMGGGSAPPAPAAPPASSAAPAGPVSGTTKSGAKFTVTPTPN